MYTAVRILGFFTPMLILMALAIIFAKHKGGWVLYAIGIGFTLLSIIGHQRNLTFWGQENMIAPYWIVFVVLLIASTSIMILRNIHILSERASAKDALNQAKKEGIRFCPECNGSVEPNEIFCPKCHHKM